MMTLEKAAGALQAQEHARVSTTPALTAMASALAAMVADGRKVNVVERLGWMAGRRTWNKTDEAKTPSLQA